MKMQKNRINLGMALWVVLSIMQSACVSDTRVGNHSLDLLREHQRTEIVYGRKILLEDKIIAFGRASAIHQQQHFAHNIAIAGQQHSYVLSKGGDDLLQLLGELEPKFIQLKQELIFYAHNNDGTFTGTLILRYTPELGTLNHRQLALLNRYAIKNGTAKSDIDLVTTLQPEYFDLGLDLAGKIYPAAENLADLKALTQPYPIVIYSSIREEKSKPLMSTTEKIVTLPITLLLDALELPFDLLEIKYQP